MDTLLYVENLTVSFDGFLALRNLNLIVERDERVRLLIARGGPGLRRGRRERRRARPGRTARARRRPGGHALARRAAVARDRDAARPGAEAPPARRAGGGDDAAGEGAHRRAHRGDRGALG